MQYRTDKGFTGPAALGILFAFVGLGLIFTGLLQWAVAITLLPEGARPDQMEAVIRKLINDPKNAEYALLFQGAGTLLLMFIPAVFFSYVVYVKIWSGLGFNKHLDIIQVILALLILLAANFIAVPFEQISRWVLSNFPSLYQRAVQIEAEYASNVELMGSLRSFSGFLTGLFMIAWLPALFEETFFRGALQHLFSRWWGRPLIGVAASAVIFSFVHLSLFLFVGRAILGFALGMIFFITKNIWVSIAAHFLNNLYAFSEMFMEKGKIKPSVTGEEASRMDWLLAVLALGAFAFLMKLLKKRSARQVARIIEDESEKIFFHS